jgi:hypothetical protein
MGDDWKAGKDNEGETTHEVQLDAPSLFRPQENPGNIFLKEYWLED